MKSLTPPLSKGEGALCPRLAQNDARALTLLLIPFIAQV